MNKQYIVKKCKTMIMMILIFAICMLTSKAAIATTVLPLFWSQIYQSGYVDSPVYGGDILAGYILWTAKDGNALLDITIDPRFAIYGFSFNANVDRSDFTFTYLDRTNWNYWGLNGLPLQGSTIPTIGTDNFDCTIGGNEFDGTNTNSLIFMVTGSAISSDINFYQPNIMPGNDDWNSLMNGVHFEMSVNDLAVSTQTYFITDHFYIPTVPEPSTMVLLGLGLMGVLGIRRKIQK